MSVLLIPESEIKTKAEYLALYKESGWNMGFEDWLFFQMLEPIEEDAPPSPGTAKQYDARDAEVRLRVARILL